MKITFTGTGIFRPDTPVGSAGVNVQHNGSMIQLDMGRGNLMNMATAGVDWRKIQAVFLTHMHPDHIGDIFQYLQAYTLLYERGEIDIDLKLFGPRDFKAFYGHMRRVILTNWVIIPEAADLIDETVEIDGFKVTAVPMQHPVEAVGFRIEAGGKTVCYTGDTEPNDNLAVLAQDADLFICECANPDESREEYGHMYPAAIAEVARNANVKKVALTHYPPDMAEREKRVEQVRSAFDGEVIAGQDTLIIELS